MLELTIGEICDFCGGRLLNADRCAVIKKAVTDSRKDMTDGVFFALKGARFDAHDFLEQAIANNAVILCVQEGRERVDYPCWIVEDTLKAYQQFGRLMLEKAAIPSVAITGSVGKTSVKEMTRAVLEYKFGAGRVLFTEENTNNHIGVPQNLIRLTSEHRAAVIEMGTNSFGEIAVLSEIVRPDAAIINSIAPCHLENLGSLDGVAKEKSAIFDYAKKLAVIPGDIPQTCKLKQSAEAKNLSISYFGNSDAADFYFSDFKGGISCSTFKIHHGDKSAVVTWNLQGEYQAQNACGVAAIGTFFGMSMDEIAEGLKNTVLPGLRARHTEKNGVHYYNDAYNANPASMTALLKMTADCIKNGEFKEEDVILLAGDMLELGENSLAEHRKIMQFIVDKMPKCKVVAVGSIYMQCADEFGIECFADAAAAGKRLKNLLEPGKWVFLKGSNSMHMENALNAE